VSPLQDPPFVDSTQNAAVRRARALERDRALRDRSMMYVAWGRRLAQEALAGDAPLHQALVGPALSESADGQQILRGLGARGVPLLRVTRRVLESIVEGCGDQGILLIALRHQHDLPGLLAAPPRLVLAAHGVQDPGNIGSIVRSARALGASGFVALEGCADPFGSRAVRASMGALFGWPVVTATAAFLLETLRGTPFDLVAADPAQTEPPADVDFARPTVLLLGSEGVGLPHDLLAGSQRRVRIPMAAGMSSLNVHAAAAILLYEVARQRGFDFPPEGRPPGAARTDRS